MYDRELNELLCRIAAGDGAALETLYREMKTPLFTVIYRIVGERTLAEDTLQELFVQLWRSCPAPQKPRAYLFAMARNLAIDALREKGDVDAFDEASEPAAAEDAVEKLDLDAALARLTSEERQIVLLHIHGGLRFREVAAIVKEPLGTVLWRYRRALGQMRDYLNGGMK
ncbi:MAG: sigma-70 family RNA polymerase sigma factor [Clostridia bacterium]|nr:sigma-70 family RNA polymerase sigma factor [Clostridia bacterium]